MLPDMPLGKWIDIPPTWLIGAIVVVWLQAWLLPGLLWPVALGSIIGTILFWGGLALIAAALWAFYRARTTPVPHQDASALITSGVFQLSRNPIYLGDALILSGVIAGWGAWLLVPLIPAFMALITVRFIQPEEDRLRAGFGEAYALWSKRTRRWV